MRIASRFSVAVHVLTLLGSDSAADLTSVFIAGSAGVNPVIVRTITGMLKRAGLVTATQGRAGTHLALPLERITLLDVYRAVGVDAELFAIHPFPNPDCSVGREIQGALEGVFSDAQRAMESRLAATTLADLLARMRAAA